MSEEKQRTIAEELSAARQERGLDLETVQQQSGISLAVLRGIESGQFDVVEPVFARLALKAYAEYLGLNPEPFLTRFDQQQGRAFQPRQRPVVLLSQPKPKHRSQTPLIAIGSVIGACFLLVGAYYFLGDKITAPTQTVSAPPEPAPAAAPNDTLLVQPPTELEAATEAAPPPTAPSSPATDTLATEAAPPPAAAIQATASSPVVLELEARDSTWVQIHWDDAEENFEGIVPPGQRHRFEARGHFVVLSTRPHGLQYWLDGQLLGDGQLGDPNKVLRFRATAAGITLLPLTDEAPDAQP